MDENLSDFKTWLSLTAVACQHLLCVHVCVHVRVCSPCTLTIDNRSEVRICLDTLTSAVICVCASAHARMCYRKQTKAEESSTYVPTQIPAP